MHLTAFLFFIAVCFIPIFSYICIVIALTPELVIAGLTRNPPKKGDYCMNRSGFVYFMTNAHNNVLYVGVTNDIVRRVAEHKAKVNKGFTYKYNCDKLVYFEEYDLVIDAITREKQIKNWKREWKNELVNKENPEWNDLSETIGVNEEWIKTIKEYYQGIAGQARNDG